MKTKKRRSKVKPTEAEKLQRKHDRKAAAMTAASKKSYGQLFEHMAPTFTRDDAYWHNRFQKARAAENHTIADKANRGLEMIRTRAIERFIVERYGDELAAKLIGYVRRTFPDSHVAGMFGTILTGRWKCGLTKELKTDPARASQYNREGRYIVESDHFPPPGVEAVTSEEFYRLFPLFSHSDGSSDPEPDDGGLFERTILRLGVAA